MTRSTTMRGLAIAGLCVVLALLALVGSASDSPRRAILALGGDDRGVDITNTPEGQRQVREAADRFRSQGFGAEIAELAATRFAGGDIVVAPKGSLIADLRSEDAGFRMTVTGRERVLLAGPLTAAEAYWSQIAYSCVSYSLPSGSFFDPCYRMYKMVNDNVAGKEYWRLTWKGTMFTASGRTLDWGWLHVDQDSGPAQTFADYSPENDETGACATETLGVQVLGAAASWSYNRCERWDISKTAGNLMGWFKNRWSWATYPPQLETDRGVGLDIASYGNNGSITYGISWLFADH